MQTGSPKLNSCEQIGHLLILEDLLCDSVDIVYAASTDSDSWIEREVFMFAPLECFVPNVFVLKFANWIIFLVVIRIVYIILHDSCDILKLYMNLWTGHVVKGRRVSQGVGGHIRYFSSTCSTWRGLWPPLFDSPTRRLISRLHVFTLHVTTEPGLSVIRACEYGFVNWCLWTIVS